MADTIEKPQGPCGCQDHQQHDKHDHQHQHDHHHHHHGACGCSEEDHCDTDVVLHNLSQPPTMTFKILDLDCPSCAKSVEDAAAHAQGVEEASVRYADATLAVVTDPTADEDQVTKAILDAVRSAGEDLDLSEERLAELGGQRGWLAAHRSQVLMAINAALLVVGLVSEFAIGAPAQVVALWAYALGAVVGVIFVAPMALSALGRRTADMNVLMAIAVIGALAMGVYDLVNGNVDPDVFRDAAIVIFLDQISDMLEGWAMERTRSSIAGLTELAPDVAHRVEGGTTVDVPTESLVVGEEIHILPGERVPVDGVIVEGAAGFDESPVTGESVPVDKTVGDQVFGGTLAVGSPVTIEVEATAQGGTLARIVDMVQGAQAQKAPYEAFVDRFAAIYTPVVVAVAAAVGIGVPLVLTAVAAVTGAGAVDWVGWIWRALTLLVIACPCALVISTPVTFVSAITRAARMGVLVKGGAYFDVANTIDTIAFDKTGTLTEGAPRVVSVTVASGASEAIVLQKAQALESQSTHPLAQAVCAYDRGDHGPLPGVTDLQEVAAQGVSGTVDGEKCFVGKPAYAASHWNVPEDLMGAVDDGEASGATCLVVVIDGVAQGVIALADGLRPTTKGALEALHHGGIPSTLMLTGDNERAAQAMGRAAGVTDVKAALLPEGKVAAIQRLQAEGHRVAMVGDGINDAPALAAADLGITMGAAASDTALAVADVALLAGDLEALPGFMALARRTMAVVRENIAFAIGVKVAVLILAVLGYAGMGAAIFADTGVAVLVVLNALRLMTRWNTRF